MDYPNRYSDHEHYIYKNFSYLAYVKTEKSSQRWRIFTAEICEGHKRQFRIPPFGREIALQIYMELTGSTSIVLFQAGKFTALDIVIMHLMNNFILL